ncbi:MAG: tRNA pseudouridine(13) synthase TruD [Nitrososphaerota archaeon]
MNDIVAFMIYYKPVLSSLRIEDIERFIGITSYVTGHEGIGGVIKMRSEDFLVWEVLETGLDAKKLFESSSFVGDFGNYILCVLKKVGVDSIRAVSLLASRLSIRSKEIGICGIKDKMSVSWQFITIPSSITEKILEDGKTISVGNLIEVKPIRWFQHRLSSRLLRNNVFRVRIRNPKTTDVQKVEEIIKELRGKGVPNYFGHQRFGITRPITPVVGRLILKRRLGEAVAAFLSDYSNLENEKNRLVRKELGEGWDLGRAREIFPKSLVYERRMIESLIKNPGDYVKCLRTLPLRLRRLIVESVGARIFNLALSEIIKEDRLNEIEVGDIVLPVDSSGRADKNRPITVTSRNIKQVEKLVKDEKMVNALPILGYLSPIPRSSKGEIILEIMEKEEIDLKDFMIVDMPEASTRGSLRPVIITKWSCSVLSVDDESFTLEFSLPPGSYATILLREIMKSENPLSYIGRHS